MPVTDYPNLLAHAPRKQQFEEWVNDLEAGLSAGSIANASYKAARDGISGIINRVYNDIRYAVKAYELPENERNYWGKAPSINALKRFPTNLNHWLNAAPESAVLASSIAALKALVPEIEKLVGILEALKDKTVKRQPEPSQEGQERYVPPSTAYGAMMRIKAMLEGMVDEKFQALVAAHIALRENLLNRFIEEQENVGKPVSPYEMFAKGGDHWAYNEVSRLVTRSANGYVPIPDSRMIIRVRAMQDAKDIREMFVVRNLRKIDGIIVAKGGSFASAEVINCDLDKGGIEGTLRFAFADGSAFTVSLNVKRNYSARGKSFYQFPIMFRDVIMSDGTVMTRPSEEKMNTIFIGKEAI